MMPSWDKGQDLFLTMAKRQEGNSLLPKQAAPWGHGTSALGEDQARLTQWAKQISAHLLF